MRSLWRGVEPQNFRRYIQHRPRRLLSKRVLVWRFLLPRGQRGFSCDRSLIKLDEYPISRRISGAFFYLAANESLSWRFLSTRGQRHLFFSSRQGFILNTLLILSHFVVGKAKGSFHHYASLRGRRGRFWGG